jgi:hypothetical protein
MLRAGDGKRLVVSLLDTTGYSAEIQAKYIGMMIFERPVTLGGGEGRGRRLRFRTQEAAAARGRGHALRLRRGRSQGS